MKFKFEKVPVESNRSSYSFFELKHPAPQNSLEVAIVGFEKTLPDYIIDRSDFPCFGIEFVVSGKGQLLLDGKSHKLQVGSTFSYGPGVHHKITSDADQPLEKCFIDLYGEPVKKRLIEIGIPAGTCLQRVQTGRIATLIKGIIEDSPKSEESEKIRQATLELILTLINCRNESAKEHSGMAYNTFKRAQDYIAQHYTEVARVVDFAERLHIDRAYMTRLFQRFANETPHHYLTRLRLARASQLLIHHNLQIQEVAAACGFEDAFHFSTLFKKHFGSSPKMFRESLQ